jgi:hypothetical protein
LLQICQKCGKSCLERTSASIVDLVKTDSLALLRKIAGHK